MRSLGAGAIALVLALTLLPLIAVAARAEIFSAVSSADWAAIRFTLWQAFLSATWSVLLAVPVARALARRRFPGRDALVILMGAPFILPVIVAVMGLLALFGRSGLVNSALTALELPSIDIFGLHGVVLAHVFLNLPLATRLLLGGWDQIPAERVRLATALGFGHWDVERHFHWPLLREVLPGAFLSIFLICTTSFAVALILGGGPRATTIELAIYQAFRFDFDLGRAAFLGLAQVLICTGFGLFLLHFAELRVLGAGLGRKPMSFPGTNRASGRIADAFWLIAAALFLILPIAMVAIRGFDAFFSMPMSVWTAAGRSVVVAVISATLACSLALCLGAYSLRHSRGSFVPVASFLGVAVSPLVIGTGLFILLRPLASPDALALPVTVLVNATVALPFVLRAITPALVGANKSYHRLSASLGLLGWTLWRHAYVPYLSRPLGFGAGLAAAFSIGDLGVIALFSISDNATLPLEMFRLMGSYRTDDAEAAALLLMALALGAFWACDWVGRRCAHT